MLTTHFIIGINMPLNHVFYQKWHISTTYCKGSILAICLETKERVCEERHLQKERETTLRHAINALRPSLRSVVELGHLGERSMRETAEIIGVSVSAAKARLFHARKALRKDRKSVV